MSPAGRPRSENAKRGRYEIRLNSVEAELLASISLKKNIAKSQILLDGLELHYLFEDYPELEEIFNALTILHPSKDKKELKDNARKKIEIEIAALLKHLE